MEPVRILSFDGGGVRDIAPAMLTAEIVKRTGKKVEELFDIIAGVSAGSLVTMSLAEGLTADHVVRVWESDAKRIFSRDFIRAASTVNGLIAPKWSLDNLEAVLDENFGDKLLNDCPMEVVIPAYETTKYDPMYFKKKSEYGSFKVKDVVLSSAAAPGYFRSFAPSNTHLNFVDGGVFAPNPSQIAYSHAGKAPNTLLLSMGTGRHVTPLSHCETAKMGFIGWVTEGNLFDVMTQSNAQNIHESLEREMPKDRYFRWQPYLKTPVALDNPDQIHLMVAATNAFISANDKEINKVCDIFNAASRK